MERFAVDLDKVLDDFELNEDLASVELANQHKQQNGHRSLIVSSSVKNSANLIDGSARPTDDSAAAAAADSVESIYDDDSFADGPTIDLSDADFAAIPLITDTLKLRFDKMATVEDDSQHDATLTLTTTSHHCIENGHYDPSGFVDEGDAGVHVGDLIPKTNSAVVLIHDSTLTSVNGVICADAKTSSGSSSKAAPPLSSWSTTSNVESGIKELHCDEVLNKDFLVTFGRRLDVTKSPSSTNIQHVDPTSIPPNVDLVDFTSAEVELFKDVDAEQFNLATDFDVTDSSQLLQNKEAEVEAGPSAGLGLDLLVTPDDDSADSAVDVAPVSFHSDVNVTDDELDSYLKDEEEDAEDDDDGGNEVILDGLSLEDGFGEQLPLNRNALFANDGEFAEVIDAPTSIKSQEANELLNKTSSWSGGQLGLGLESVATKDDVSLESAESNVVVVPSVLMCLVPDEETRSQGVPDDVTLMDEVMQVQQVTSDDSDERLMPTVAEHNSELVSSPEDADEGYEAGEASPPISDNSRVLRPTSLFLPGKLDYHPPQPANLSPSCQDQSRDEVGIHLLDERLPFSSLVSTAGSPEAVEFSTPVSLAECAVAESYIENERILGRVAPVWVPDSDAPNCMQCDVKFTVIKRRHHCRACGKVLCASCCSMKARLRYMDNKEARVCLNCVEVMKRVDALESEEDSSLADGYAGAAPRSFQATALPSPTNAVSRSPNPNNPSEYCSMIPPLEQVQSDVPPPTVMVPVGVLKRTGGRAKGEPKQVMFSDGIRPGGDLTELDVPDEPMLPSRKQPAARTVKKVDQKMTDQSMPQACLNLMSEARQQELSVDDPLDMTELLPTLQAESAAPVVFSVTKNLRVLVKIINLDCCIHKTCWSFTTQGMSAVGQDEIVVLLEMLPYEEVIPGDIFRHLGDVYEDASKGVTVSGMGHSIFSQSFLGSREHGGFLYVRSTFQCLSNLVLPPAPYLFAVLLQKWETPWAKVFPLRLFLRLGAESRYYPCPLVGSRFRKPVYCEIGHTIMNLLADFRNYQYTLPSIPGLTIHMEDKQTFIGFPRNRYDEVVKAINSSIDHVLALAATFNVQADSHLVCIQSEDGTYHTQAINIKDKPRKVTGASFVVFNGALKSSTGLTAKSSIVEDGLMVQISSDSNQALRQALRDMKDYVIPCGPIGAEVPDDVVHLRWVDDDRNVNVGVESPIDGMPMDGVSSIRIHCGTDYVGDGLVIRWTEVYLVKTEDGHRSDPVDLGKISDCLASACCLALTPHLVDLFSSGLVKIGLRVTLDVDNVGYEIGACGSKLPSRFMNDLDGELVPAIHGAAAHDGALILELIFHLLRQ